MELNEIFKALENNLKETNNQLGFKKAQAEGNELSFASDSGVISARFHAFFLTLRILTSVRRAQPQTK